MKNILYQWSSTKCATRTREEVSGRCGDNNDYKSNDNDIELIRIKWLFQLIGG